MKTVCIVSMMIFRDEKKQISELLQRAQEDAMEAGASTEVMTFEETSASADTANDSEAFADAFATSEESTKARTGGKIGKIHTITLENGKKQKVVEFYYEGGITGGYLLEGSRMADANEELLMLFSKIKSEKVKAIAIKQLEALISLEVE